MSDEFKECASCGCKTFGHTMRCCDNPIEKTPGEAYTETVIAVMRDTISAQREAIQNQRALIAQLQADLEEGAEAMALARAIIGAGREHQAQLAAARTLLEDASGAIDEACYPVWWAQWRQFLNREGVAT